MSDTRPSRRLASSTVTVAVVTTFLVLASLAGFAGESEIKLATTFGAAWSLRGTLVPAAEASTALGRAGSDARPDRPPLQAPRNAV